MTKQRTVTSEFAEKLHSALAAYRSFSSGRQITSCRLVQYVGADSPNAIDVAIGDIEEQISGCLAEGFLVGWFAEGDRMYLWVQEPGCPVPPRAKVVAEEAFVDVDALLRAKGL
jgi:hypothetical protein